MSTIKSSIPTHAAGSESSYTVPAPIPTSPSPHASNHDASPPNNTPIPQKKEPLYTEINIPLPPLPAQPPNEKPKKTSPPHPEPQNQNQNQNHHTRSRSRSLSLSLVSFPFHRSPSPPKHLVKPSVTKSRETAAAMDLRQNGRRGRRSTVDALAVVPAVLVLSAELFTPGGGGRGGLVEGGMI